MERQKTEKIKIDLMLLQSDSVSAELTPDILPNYSAQLRCRNGRRTVGVDMRRLCVSSTTVCLRTRLLILCKDDGSNLLLGDCTAICTMNSKLSMVNCPTGKP